MDQRITFSASVHCENAVQVTCRRAFPCPPLPPLVQPLVFVGCAGFSSWVSHRTMLRRPSESPGTHRGEGCTSTAFGSGSTCCRSGWINPASRGSDRQQVLPEPAVP